MNKPKPIYIRSKDRLVDFPIAEEIMIEELEKIKAEIKEESYSIINIDGDFYDLGYRIVDIEDMNEIIDKHISELKGE